MDLVYKHDTLLNFTETVFIKNGMNKADAELAAKVLIEADLRGIDSHGEVFQCCEHHRGY